MKPVNAGRTLFWTLALFCAVVSCADVKPTISPERFQQTVQGPGAYRFESPRAEAVQTLARQGATWSPAEIEAVSASFRELPRNEVCRGDLLELKFGLQHWRIKGRTALQQKLLAARSASEALEALRGLNRLASVNAAPELIAVGKKLTSFPDQRDELLAGFAELVVLQGDSEKTREVQDELPQGFRPTLPLYADGPELVPDIPASRESSWPFERILSTPALSHYLRDADGRVRYRGMSFKPGDLLFVNLTNPSEGLFTSFVSEENYAYHLALYVELEKDGLKFPCVYESYEHGTRIVPLVTYLNPRHTLYVEVYRFREFPKESDARLGAAVLETLPLPHGFNIYIHAEKSAGGRYITCTTAVTQVLRQVGFAFPDFRTQIQPGVQKNLANIGILASEMQTPSDFLLLADQVSIVGWHDNLNWKRHLASTLTTRYLTRLLETRNLDPGDDGVVGVYRFGTRAIQQDTFLLGGLLRWTFGFTKNTFPTGPTDALAFILRLEEKMDSAVEKVEGDLRRNNAFYESTPWFSVHGAFSDPQLASLVADRFSVSNNWFKLIPQDPAAPR